jgi:hypothetical protein
MRRAEEYFQVSILGIPCVFNIYLQPLLFVYVCTGITQLGEHLLIKNIGDIYLLHVLNEC